MTDQTDGSARPDAHAREELAAELKSAWANQLRNTHEFLLDECRSSCRPNHFIMPRRLLPVAIEIFEGTSRWGWWNPRTRVIGLSARLIMARPWDVVEGVLAHETAHQLSDDLGLWGLSGDDNPHGRGFQLACDMLALHPVFRRAGVDLMEAGPPPSIFSDETLAPPKDPVLDKIKKLLALSGSPEPHEAASALAMASRLMAKRNIERSELEVGPDGERFQRWQLDLRRKKLSSADMLMGRILHNHFFVKVVFTYRYDREATEAYRAIEILGRPANLHMARHALLFLRERAETLWRANKPRLAALGEKGLAARNSFINQMLDSFDDKLRSAESEPFQGRVMPSSAVILKSDAGLKEFFDLCHPRLLNTRSNRAAYAPAAAEAGREAGRALTIHPPVAGGSGGGGAAGELGWKR